MKKCLLFFVAMSLMVAHALHAEDVSSVLFDFVTEHAHELALHMHRGISFDSKIQGNKKKKKKGAQQNQDKKKKNNKKNKQHKDQQQRSTARQKKVDFPSAEELAFDSVKAAAEGGYVPAADLLAYCYATGTGTKIDEKLAFCWYMKAALDGSQSAKDSLVTCFDNGVGVEKNQQVAKILQRLLASKEHGQSQK